MKVFVFLALFLGQACQQVEFDKQSENYSLLLNYINTCREKNFFFDDKGVVKLIICKNAEGLTEWHLSALIDDRYQSSPPEQYAFIKNDIVLIYSGNSNGEILPIQSDLIARNECIQEVLGSRVYKQTTGKQFVYSRDAQGIIKKIPVSYVSLGNSHNDLIIIFNKDKTITRLKPV